MTGALNRVLDAVAGALNLFRFWFIVDDFERAVVLRLGRFHRAAGPGFHWQLPLRIEQALRVNVRKKTGSSWDQTLTTCDGTPVTLCFSWCTDVVDAEIVLLQLDDWKAVSYQIVRIAVSDMVHRATIDEFLAIEFVDRCREYANERLRQNGIRLRDFGLIDRAVTPAIRFFRGAS